MVALRLRLTSSGLCSIKYTAGKTKGGGTLFIQEIVGQFATI